MRAPVRNLIFLDFIERFSFTAFLTAIIYYLSFVLKYSENHSAQIISYFKMISFFFPLISSIIITIFYRIQIKFALSVIIFYLFGHILLMESYNYLIFSIVIIGIGAGMLKPLVMSVGGLQFSDNQEQGEKTKFFNYVYLAANLGAFVAFLILPNIIKISIKYAFFISFLTLFVGLLFFLFFFKRYKVDNVISGKEKKFKFNKNLLYFFIILIPYCSLYDQILTLMPMQGFRMNSDVFGIKISAFHIQCLEPLLIIFFVPILLKKIITFDVYQKLFIGFLLFFIASIYNLYIEYALLKEQIHLLNQVFVIVLMVFSEIFLYPTFVQITFGDSKNTLSSIAGSLIFATRAICNFLNVYIFKLFDNNVLSHRIFIVVMAFLIILILKSKKGKFQKI